VSDKETAHLSHELVVGLLVAVMGFAGVLAGGLVSYLANKSLQARETQRSEQMELRVAKSAAAFERTRLLSLRQALQEIVETNLVDKLPPWLLTSQLGTAELSVMLMHLDEPRLSAYSQAQVCARRAAHYMTEAARDTSGDGGFSVIRLYKGESQQIKREQACIRAGEGALVSLAEQSDIH
jgi:hypothetical protein